ncbi:MULTISPECIES: RidA family protein [Pseudomonadaceae]|uniref:RidA family protein n=1 Tax=Pseudomonadaceae TaxID=135621 RepID=UPI00187D6D7C|nr:MULTISPECIES: RidA family protein [Pseudomonadaceae]MBE7928220.1 RidA family protein [Pseudomonas saudiphocaensis]MCF6781263.1 RidA family protein [Stutzerimonas stutzeri]MCF6805159.1 RidA family protein [Stutzerimonas stutzeri]
MAIKRLHTELRYSDIVINQGTVYLSGQLADDLSGDIRQQTRETLAHIDRLLAEAGTDRSHLLSALIHLRDLADYAGMNEIWDSWLPPGAAPARTTVQAMMYAPQVRVEITVVAALPER